jgi:hypothetical protein
MSTTRAGARGPALAVWSFLLVISSGFPAGAVDPSPLAGTVRDSLGNLLAGVEVLVVALPSAGFEPSAVAHSDQKGQFRVARLNPGRYRIAALKQGYRTYVGQVDTAARVDVDVDVVLEPTGDHDEQPLAREAAWALRVPRRGMLHDVDPHGGALGAAGSESARNASPGPLEGSLQVEQLFSVGAGAAGAHPEEPDFDASETRLGFATRFGGGARLHVAGLRENLDAVANPDTASVSGASLDGGAAGLEASVDTGANSRLSIEARFRRTEYGVTAGTQDALEQSWQSWGVDAGWTREIDSRRRVAVRLDYRDASVDGGWSDDPDPFSSAPAAEDEDVGHRSAGAKASFATVVGERHDMQVAVRAEARHVAPASSGLPVSAASLTWLVDAEAVDTWALSGPFSLIGGLGYRQALAARDGAVFTPTLGGAVSAGGAFARAVVSYHGVSGPVATDSAGPFRPESHLGYEADVEVPLARDLRLRGSSSYAPLQRDTLGYLPGDGMDGEHPLYATDGNAAVREHRLTLVEERGSSKLYAELADGQTRGTVAPFVPFADPLPLREGQELRYRRGRMGLAFPARGTDLHVEYRRVDGEGTPEAGGGLDSREEALEMRVRQEVSGLPVPGSWRLLLALRLWTLDTGDLAEEPAEVSASVDALNRRLSAGVSVLF